jgi:hypothetical protein
MTALQFSVRIRPGARYTTASGRICRWLPKESRDSAWLTFAYCDGRREEFTLTPAAAQRVLREVPAAGGLAA